MKHSLKISSFIIFAAIAASVFTSCGNDSELFDEPVMYQTRAMTRASMRIEQTMGEWVIKEPGENVKVESDLGHLGKAYVYFTWYAGSTPGTTYLESKCEIELNNKYYYREKSKDLVHRAFHTNKPRALYNIEIIEKKYDSYTGNVRDTVHQFRHLEFMTKEEVELIFKPLGTQLMNTIANSDSLTIQKL